MKKTTPKLKAKKPRTKSRSTLKPSKKLSWQNILPVSMLLAAVGFFLVSMSQASGISSQVSGRMDWHGSGVTKPTRSFVSRDGNICVTANFNKYSSPLVNYEYTWKLQEFRYGQWTTIRKSSKYSANGNRDHECYSGGIKKKGTYYRVTFDPGSNFVYVHGSYWVWGYKHN